MVIAPFDTSTVILLYQIRGKAFHFNTGRRTRSLDNDVAMRGDEAAALASVELCATATLSAFFGLRWRGILALGRRPGPQSPPARMRQSPSAVSSGGKVSRDNQ
jgi:hypothetical protein